MMVDGLGWNYSAMDDSAGVSQRFKVRRVMSGLEGDLVISGYIPSKWYTGGWTRLETSPQLKKVGLWSSKFAHAELVIGWIIRIVIGASLFSCNLISTQFPHTMQHLMQQSCLKSTVKPKNSGTPKILWMKKCNPKKCNAGFFEPFKYPKGIQ